MPDSNWIVGSGAAAGVNSGVNRTRYTPLGGVVTFAYGTDPAWNNTMARGSYTLSNLYSYVTANDSTDAATLRSRKNGANGAQSISILAGATGAFEDTTNSDSLVDGDIFSTSLTVGAGTVGLTVSLISMKILAASDIPILIATNAASAVGFGATTYYPLVGTMVPNTTEARPQYTFRAASTLSTMRIGVGSNNVDAASTFRTRLNGGNGSQSVSVPASTTGAFEDTTNTDSVVAGDEVNYQLVAGGTSGNIYVYNSNIKSASIGMQVAAATPAATALSANLTRYVVPQGSSQSYASAEAGAQVKARSAFTAKNLFVNVPTNSVNGASTFTFRNNEVNGNLTVSVASSTTGLFEDTANSDSVVATDLIDYAVATGGTTGSMQITSIGFELAQVGAGINLERLERHYPRGVLRGVLRGVE